ncbi:hypothetical protein P8625_05650 [Tenacibaculum tangerinum]|uniref:Uncharacterized protein n=1 Tax=Tenacibaculum tangerinum TaxID=3038772 RepID=A0ABY8L5E7_9FLAO|nr:hypothetical protein [Tenacibaculum tangerinum]WGH76643.1 hypothetical protein P8625_05650 [Tenacibaculum tangerinum]
MKNSIFLTALVSILLCSCNSNPSKKPIDSTNLTVYKKGKKPRKINAKEKQTYKRQLEIVQGDKDFSYFDKDTQDSIVLRIPVASDKYRLHNIYNVSNGNHKGILVIISDSTRNRICEITERTHIIDTTVFAHKLKHFKTKSSLNLKKNDFLSVFVFNDYIPDFKKDSLKYINRHHDALLDLNFIWGCENSLFEDMFDPTIKKPKETGGGVIVSFP